MNLPAHNDDPAASPFTLGRDLELDFGGDEQAGPGPSTSMPTRALTYDFGGEQLHPVPFTFIQTQALTHSQSRHNAIIERIESPISNDDDDEDEDMLYDTDHKDVPPPPPHPQFSHSTSSLIVLNRWAEKVYFLWVPLTASGLELRNEITTMLFHPTSLNQTPRGIRMPCVQGPNVEAIVKGLLAVILSGWNGHHPLLPENVTLSPGFHVRNLINNSRDWHVYVLFLSCLDFLKKLKGHLNREQGGGDGVEIDIFHAMAEQIAGNPTYCKGPVDGDFYQNLNPRPTLFNASICHAVQTLGSAAALHLYITKWGPHSINPLVLIFAVAGWEKAIDLDVVEKILPAKVTLLRDWPRVLTPAVDLSIGSVVGNLIIELLDGIMVRSFTLSHLSSTE